MKLYLISIILIDFLMVLSDSISAVEERYLSRQKRLLFPQYTVLQLSLCVISQVSQLPDHRVAVNVGFQLNYQMPYQLSSWYSPMFWARKLTGETNPLVSFFERLVENDGKEEEIDDESSGENEATTNFSEKKSTKVKRDLSAAEFYVGLMDTFNYAGYHDDCLLKSICELAKHPLEINLNEENLMEELIHYVLTPSTHQAAFKSEDEHDERKIYEEAERMGIRGEDCDLIFSECKETPLHHITNFV